MNIDITPTTVRSMILESIADRLKQVVDNWHCRADRVNKILTGDQISCTGTYAGAVPRVFYFEVTAADTISCVEKIQDDWTDVVDSEVDYTVVSGDSYAVSDTGMSFIPTFDTLEIGDTFELRFNTCIETLRGVYRWERVRENIVYPGIIVFPVKELKTRVPSDRFDCELHVVLSLWFDADPEAYNRFEEVLGDVLNLLDSNVQFGPCLNYDSAPVKVEIEDADGNSEVIIGYIELVVRYRHAAKNTRTPRN